MAGKCWREAATLMLISKTSPTCSVTSAKGNFKVLMMKRSSKSKFMPNACVFPGGVVDKADFSPEWLSIFKDASLPMWSVSAPLPMIYQPKEEDGIVPREIAFRINAIRETYEETGILLTLRKSTQIDPCWRERIHKKPMEFLRLCKDHELCPDIWNLSEWSDWLTPLHLPTKARFDTMFYVAFVDDLDESLAATDDNQEVSQVDFYAPSQALKLHNEEKIWLAPPQVYEISRLAAFSTFDSLRSFAQARAAQNGIDTWFPVFANCADGGVAIYPGDEAYPSHPDMEGANATEKALDMKDMTVEEFASKYGTRNRMVVRSLHNNIIDCNIADPNGHRSPLAHGAARNSSL